MDKSTVGRSLASGDFVRAKNQLGVGQIAGVRGSEIEIVYFDSVTKPDALREKVAQEDVALQILEVGRCCFVPSERGWLAGRVKKHELNRYLVSLPNDERWLGPPEFRVRWDRPAASPIEDLIGGWWSDPRMVERRVEFLQEQARQFRIASGLIGATSIAAELHEHQIDIVKRILDDPIGRFLLADEVGIGKTIEALMVARQVLVDDPECVVRVIVPRHLRSQWSDELRLRAQIDPTGGKGDFPLAGRRSSGPRRRSCLGLDRYA